jgi:hypothetical protein
MRTACSKLPMSSTARSRRTKSCRAGKDVDDDFSNEKCTSNFLIVLSKVFASVVERNFLFPHPKVI